MKLLNLVTSQGMTGTQQETSNGGNTELLFPRSSARIGFRLGEHVRFLLMTAKVLNCCQLSNEGMLQDS